MHQILFVDDELSILKSIKRLFLDSDYDIITAQSGLEAIDIVKHTEISVCVADQRMSGMSGTELLTKIKDLSPFTTRVLLTGYTDLDSILCAINSGEIFRFILKPWDDSELISQVDMAVAKFKKKIAKNEKLMLALAETIELKDPYTKGHCQRVAEYAVAIAKELDLNEKTITAIRYGAWLHDCGKIGIKEATLNLPGNFNDDQKKEMCKHPEAGANVAKIAGFSPQVINTILYHHEKLNGTGYPKGLKGKNIPLEAQIVAVADIYDALSTDRPYRRACSAVKTKEIMHKLKGNSLDGLLIDILLEKVICDSDIV